MALSPRLCSVQVPRRSECLPQSNLRDSHVTGSRTSSATFDLLWTRTRGTLYVRVWLHTSRRLTRSPMTLTCHLHSARRAVREDGVEAVVVEGAGGSTPLNKIYIDTIFYHILYNMYLLEDYAKSDNIWTIITGLLLP